MSHSFGLVIESLVAVLLLLTIGYCMLLNRRLKRLRADEQSMRAMIAELITATEIAERAIGGLKVTTLVVLILATLAFFKRSEIRAFDRAISHDQVLKVLEKSQAGAAPAFITQNHARHILLTVGDGMTEAQAEAQGFRAEHGIVRGRISGRGDAGKRSFQQNRAR